MADSYVPLAPYIASLRYQEQGSIGAIRILRLAPELGNGSFRVFALSERFTLVSHNYVFNRRVQSGYDEMEGHTLGLSFMHSCHSRYYEPQDHQTPIGQGLMMFINRRCTGRAEFAPQVPVRGIGMSICDPFFEHWLTSRLPREVLEQWQTPMQVRMLPSYTPALQMAFQQIDHALSCGINNELYYEGKVLEVLGLLAFQMEQIKPLSTQTERKWQADRQLFEQIQAQIDAAPCHDHRIEQLARTFYIGKTKLQNLFQRYAGISVHQYIREARLRQALVALEQNDPSIASIARSIGYQNASMFSRAFVAVYGVTPSDYRNSLQALAESHH